MIGSDDILQILQEHVNDCFAQERSLASADDKAIHEFRLACKRLRFALERFAPADRQLLAKSLSEVTDALGSAHDSVVLAKHARNLDAGAVAWRAMQDRSRFMQDARRLWATLAPALRRLAAA